MMRYEESGCVSCSFPCIRDSCPYYRVLVMTCDRCGEETDTLYYGRSGDELCADCALEELEKVRVEE